MSLSSRRAWIEMVVGLANALLYIGRSPHGERGLKSVLAACQLNRNGSLSSRRAWIEIAYKTVSEGGELVALLTESVD